MSSLEEQESVLDYWRNDPQLNEHHEHWHSVYPYAGRAVRSAHTEHEARQVAARQSLSRLRVWNPRHGELFVYMHRQLLARYAAERLSAGLPAVLPLDDYRAPIPESFTPPAGLLVLDERADAVPLAGRAAHSTLRDITVGKNSSRPGAKVVDQETFRERLSKAVTARTHQGPPRDLGEYAERIEPTDRFASPYFGALHNDGHLLISLYDDPYRPGPMFWEATALRDPVFYRWHQHVDTFFQAFQATLPAHRFDDLPPVEIGAASVVSTSGVVNVVSTSIRRRAVKWEPSARSGYATDTEVHYLAHEGFSYLIDIANRSEIELTVVIRVFLAPEESVNDWTAWIEMDKFRRTLSPGPNQISRDAALASVLRHPVLTPDMLDNPALRPDTRGTEPGCECGWPYTLLLPRGLPGGMSFRLVILATPGEDISANMADPNSASYCGVSDGTYPDVRPMGYPFDRPLPQPIDQWLSSKDRPCQLQTLKLVVEHRP